MNPLVNQLIGVGVTIAFSAIGTFIILKVIDLVIGIRVSSDEEIEGLDLSQHNENGHML
jgi:Amt family ammonium transporter